MRKVPIGSALLLLLCVAGSAAQEGELILTLGRLTTNSMGATQVLSVENKTSKNFERVEVECGFYSGTKLVGNGSAFVHELLQARWLTMMLSRFMPAMLTTSNVE